MAIRNFKTSDVKMVPVDSLTEPNWNYRIHTERGIEALCESIRRVGYIDPIIVWKDGLIIAGGARWKAAQKLELKEVPIIDRSDLTEAQAKWYSLASNRVAEFNGYDEMLRYELAKALEEQFEEDLEPLFTEEELEERRQWIEDFDVEEPEEVEEEESPETPERMIQAVEVTIKIPAGLWASLADEVSALVKGLQERHPEILYTVKEVKK